MPALWRREKTLIAYSREGYDNKTWQLPPEWKDVDSASLFRITLNGHEKVREVTVTNGTLSLAMDKREALMIVPAKL